MRVYILSRIAAFSCGAVLLSISAVAQDNNTDLDLSIDQSIAAPQQMSSADSSGVDSTVQTPTTEDPRDRIYYPGDTERAVPLGKKLFGNLLLDQKEIWRSPFKIGRDNAGWWILFGGGTAALIATDRHTIGAFENSPGQIAWGNHVSNIGASYTLIPLVAGFYTYGALRDNAQARETGVLGAEALIDSLVVVEVLKHVAGRVRPDSTTGERGHFFDGGDSFPSGHSIESWALASVISHEYKRYGGKWVPYAAYGLAGVVSAARFTAQRHYASDIVAGAAMGWFIGRYVYQTHEDHSGHARAWAHPQISPNVNPVTRLYTVALSFNLE